MVVREFSPIYKFGALLWELIFGQPPPNPGEGFHLVLFLESIMCFIFCIDNCLIVGHLIHERVVVAKDPI
jgi:hypothetical protein